MSMTNQEEFAARLARVRDGAPNTKGTIFIGQDERHHFVRPEATGAGTGQKGVGHNPLSLAVAFGLGLLAVGVANVARFHFIPAPALPEDADTDMMIAAGIGMALSLMFGWAARLTSSAHLALQAAGVIVMVCGFHNLAHWAPGPMSGLLSPEWVAEMQAGTPANSVWYRGQAFALLPKAATTAADLDEVTPLPEDASEAGAETAEDAPCAVAPAEASDVTILQPEHAKKAKKSKHKTVSTAEATCATP